MFVDLIGVTTSDGIKLDGAFLEPAKHQKSGAAIDAVLVIHGSTGISTPPPPWEWPRT